jgi:hypothetical protein
MSCGGACQDDSEVKAMEAVSVDLFVPETKHTRACLVMLGL